MKKMVYLMVVMVSLSHVASAAEPSTDSKKTDKQKTSVYVTCSWDDGHKNDARVADLLRKYKAKGTFFIYPENYVLYTKDPKAALKKDPFLNVPIETFVKTYDGLEVGAHGFQHPNLAKLETKDLRYQLSESKKVLESWFKRPVKGMAYPYGAYNDEVEKEVKKAGYVYARTVTKSQDVTPVKDPYALKVSLKFNDPNFWTEFERVKKNGGTFYFWGHSHEIKTEADWKAFEDKLARLSADPSVKWVTNLELFEK